MKRIYKVIPFILSTLLLISGLTGCRQNPNSANETEADGDRLLLQSDVIQNEENNAPDEEKYTPNYDSTSTLHADVF